MGTLARCLEAADRLDRDPDRGADEQQGLGERSEMLRLAMPVLVALVGGSLGDRDRVQRQERRERVGRRVHGLREHAEAARRDPDEDLDADEEDRGSERHHGCAAAWRHAAMVVRLALAARLS